LKIAIELVGGFTEVSSMVDFPVRKLLLVGGLEPWNFTTFPSYWEWTNHPK